MRKWALAVYLVCTNLKSVSSMKLHRDIGVTQKTAWFMLHRIRETWAVESGVVFAGPVEVDEAYFGGLERNKHESKKLKAGRGTVGKVAVVGAKDRATKQVAARVVDSMDKDTLQGFVDDHAAPGAQVYMDGTSPYKGIDRPHETVRHSVGRVRPGQGAHERRRVILVYAEARAQGHVSPAERQAPTAVCERVRGASEHARTRHDRSDDARCRRSGRAAADVRGLGEVKNKQGVGRGADPIPAYGCLAKLTCQTRQAPDCPTPENTDDGGRWTWRRHPPYGVSTPPLHHLAPSPRQTTRARIPNGC